MSSNVTRLLVAFCMCFIPHSSHGDDGFFRPDDWLGTWDIRETRAATVGGTKGGLYTGTWRCEDRNGKLGGDAAFGSSTVEWLGELKGAKQSRFRCPLMSRTSGAPSPIGAVVIDIRREGAELHIRGAYTYESGTRVPGTDAENPYRIFLFSGTKRLIPDRRRTRERNESQASSGTPSIRPPDGFGRGTVGGGIDGKVFTVTRLGDEVRNPKRGTLRWALMQARGLSGAVVKFGVSGTIELERRMPVPSHVTIAGETAPQPDGITIYGGSMRIENATQVILRYLRIRAKPNAVHSNRSLDAIAVIKSNKVLIDHCSVAWGHDGTLDISDSADVTVRWCIIAEPQKPHPLASLVTNSVEGRYSSVTMHHNLFAHGCRRMPKVTCSGGRLDFELVNNVMYNWDMWATHIGHHSTGIRASVVGNYYVAGPITGKGTFPAAVAGCQAKDGTPCYVRGAATSVYFGNLNANMADLDGMPGHAGANGQILQPNVHEAVLKARRFRDFPPPVPTQMPHEAYEAVLGLKKGIDRGAGPSLFDRDSTDERIIDDVLNRDPDAGIVDNPPDPPQ